MQIAICDLKDRNLDLAVAISLGFHTYDNFCEYEEHPAFSKEFEPDEPANVHCLKTFKNYTFYHPSQNWAQGGEVIEQMPNLQVKHFDSYWVASITASDGSILHTGETFLEACLKVFVEYTLNCNIVDIPPLPVMTPTPT